MGRAARSRAAAIAASSPAFASRSVISWVNGSVLTPAAGREASAVCSSAIAVATPGECGSLSATARSPRESSTIAAKRGLGPQRLDLEGLDRIEQGRRSAHRFGRGLEREIGLLALPGVAPALGDARAVLGESEQLFGLCGVGLDLGERLGRVAGGEPFDGVAGVRDASAKARGIGPRRRR